MNVFEYFTKEFNYNGLSDRSIKNMMSMSVDSPCGQDCTRTINAFSEVVRSIYNAYGDGDIAHSNFLKQMVLLEDVLNIYIVG